MTADRDAVLSNAMQNHDCQGWSTRFCCAYHEGVGDGIAALDAHRQASGWVPPWFWHAKSVCGVGGLHTCTEQGYDCDAVPLYRLVAPPDTDKGATQ